MSDYAICIIYKGEVTQWVIGKQPNIHEAIESVKKVVPDCEVVSAVRCNNPVLLAHIVESLTIHERMVTNDKGHQ